MLPPEGSEYPIWATQGDALGGLRPHAWPACSALPPFDSLFGCARRVGVYPLPGHTLRPLQDFWACSRQTTLPRWYADILPRRGEPYEHRGVYHRLVL